MPALKRTGNYSRWRQGALKLLKMAPKRAESALDGAKRADLTHHGARRALSWRRAHLCGAPAHNETHRVANRAPRVANRAIGMAGRPAGPSQANANLKSNQISNSPQS